MLKVYQRGYQLKNAANYFYALFLNFMKFYLPGIDTRKPRGWKTSTSASGTWNWPAPYLKKMIKHNTNNNLILSFYARLVTCNSQK